MRTPASDLFGIEFPILAFSHCRDVVAAVTKAGGMGVLGAVAHSAEQLEIDLRWIEDEVGDLPYGVDLIIPAKLSTGDSADAPSVSDITQLLPPGHHRFLEELLDRYGVPELAAEGTGWARGQEAAPFSADRATDQLDVALAHPVALVANALGPPPGYLIERVHDAGAKVAALAGKAVHAERHVAAGVDLIVAQGSEAGGHTGEIGSMVLIPEIVDAVAPIPVLGAGGIGRGRQMAAAMALGAQGVWCGSVWLTTEEAETHPTVKQKMLTATSADTVRSRSLTGKPARQLRSAWTDEWARDDTPEPLGMPLQPVLVAEAQRRIDRAAYDGDSGAAELSNYFVGQIVGSMSNVKTSRQVVFEMIDEFIDATQTLASLLDE
ncbi:MAG: nitronate monooxygenase [Acidimicrobiia bacterium]|nr:nitronate monooxygenase [Acidimicrobiia bacterium]